MMKSPSSLLLMTTSLAQADWNVDDATAQYEADVYTRIEVRIGPSQAKLEAMLLSLDPGIRVLARLGSVKDTLAWLSQNAPPDVAFVDIQLADDHSFEIFRKYPVQFPVIFTTAFDKYLLESFEFNSIDYLLKPITEEKLKRSLSKLKKLEQHFVQGNILKLIGQVNTSGKDRIVARKGTAFIALTLDEIAFFFHLRF